MILAQIEPDTENEAGHLRSIKGNHLLQDYNSKWYEPELICTIDSIAMI